MRNLPTTNMQGQKYFTTLINSIGHTAVASMPPAIHPAVIAVRGFFDLDMVLDIIRRY